MKRKMYHTDYCPTLNENYSISIEYQKVSTTSFNGFIKNTFRCEHNIYGDGCQLSDCPVYLSAPEML